MTAFAFLAGIGVAIVACIASGRISIVIVRHSTERPRGSNGRFLTDREVSVRNAFDVASRKTGSFGG